MKIERSSGVLIGFWACLTLVAAILEVSSCASVNPVASASDINQKAYALYGTFVIFEEQGASLVKDPTVPTNLRLGIRLADAKAKPSADALVTALKQAQAAQAALNAGTGTAEQLTIATNNINTWVTQAQGDIAAFVAAVNAVPGH